MSSRLRMASDFSLPVDAVTQRLAFLGKPGSGKSYAATRLAELMYGAGAQFIALDPVGIWYGLRVAGDGPGLPVTVFGGLHGDVPLTPTSGALIADLLVDRRLSCVLDTSQFEHDAEKTRFAAAFANRFFFRMKAAPAAVHLFLEECQEYVPQNPQRGEEQMLHDFTRIDKLGRNFGIGVSLISQRPQEVNKKVLNLTECLFAFQMTGAHERKAIKDWIAAVGADENILTVLPTLAVARAHVYSPQWLRVSEVITIGRKQTADVSSTPAVGASKAIEKPLTRIDLGKIRDAMAESIERAKADDPKELRKEIAALKKQLAGAPTKEKGVEKAIVDERAMQRAVAAALKPWQEKDAKVVRLIQRAGAAHAAFVGAFNALADTAGTTTVAAPVQPVAALRSAPAAGPASVPFAVAPPRRERTAMASADGAAVGKTGRKILAALAFYESIGKTSVPASVLAAFVGMTASGGSWGARVSELRQADYISGSGTLALTDAGRAVADATDVPSSLAELHDAWRAKLGGKAREMLNVLIDAYPNAVSKEDLAAAVDMELSGGSFGARLSEVRARGLLDGSAARGEVRASDVLFPEGLA